jgi:hypothetical protein
LIDVVCKYNAIDQRGNAKADEQQLNKAAAIGFDVEHRLFLKK